MTVIVINIKEERIDSEDQSPSDVLESLPIPSKSPDDDTVSPEYVQKLLRQLPSDALKIRQSIHEPEWGFGEPCPVCGTEALSAMTVSEDIYNSSHGDRLQDEYSRPHCRVHKENLAGISLIESTAFHRKQEGRHGELRWYDIQVNDVGGRPTRHGERHYRSILNVRFNGVPIRR